ncbi:DUF397 domain-containing protein [Streptomyces sp. NPDC004658]|uniref:DUF397 domain-containing protein n=1 Tax=Streptomyces TaxID=1883 RepID=UPI0033A8F39A
MTVQSQRPDLSKLDLSNLEGTVSSYSGGGGDCVRVGRMGDWILVSDTKCPDRVPLLYPLNGARAWIQSVKDGVFDPIAGLD